MDFAPDRKHELENHVRRLRLHLYHYDEETIDDYYRVVQLGFTTEIEIFYLRELSLLFL